jgi:ceramide glucosyltransferase
VAEYVADSRSVGVIVEVLQVVLLGLVALSLLGTLVSHAFAWYYFASYDRRFPRREYAPPVSVVKPVKGVDQSASGNFRGFCEQDYPSDYEVVFCVEGRDDPSVPVIERIIEEYADRDVRLIFSDPEDARSVGKLKNMIAGYAHSSYDVIVFSDSDAQVPPSFLRETVACLEIPEVGLGFGAPAYVGARDWAAALMAFSANPFVLRLASMCLFRAFDGAVGTTMVVRRDAIERVGGLERFGRHITDDIPLGRALREEGYHIHLLKQPACVSHPHYTFGRWWTQMHRWLVTIRRYWPNNFLITSAVDLAPWWALLYLLVSLLTGDGFVFGACLLAAALGTPLLSQAVVNARFVREAGLWRYLWVVLVHEAVRVALVLYAAFTDEVVWRGRRMRVDSDGTVELVGRELR